jgi:methylase of polypeptide subunit release factors
MPAPPTIAPATPSSLRVDTAAFLGIANPRRILPALDIALSDHCYQPRVDDPLADWVASVAAPAFHAVRRQSDRSDAFASCCSIGTGSGLDMLTAIEILGSTRVGITDLHADVVTVAADNIARNLRPEHRVVLAGGAGDLLAPLAGHGRGYDVIYENLPNTPLRDGARIDAAQTSSKHLAARREALPRLVTDNLLALHYLALRQAHDYLAPGGTVLSTIGARVPLTTLLRMAELAGHAAQILIYTWKYQADAAEMAAVYAAWQDEGLGPFHFYPAGILRAAFAALDPGDAGARVLDIEHALLPHRLDAVQARAALERGETLAHTVAVLQSRPRAGTD